MSTLSLVRILKSKTMNQYERFLLNFVAVFLLLMIVILGFVTWMDPFQNLNFPWKIDFISDRNPAYKRFHLLSQAPGVTDLIIGSSTSEVFVPQVLKEKYGVQAFAGNSGGASLPSRYLMIRNAFATQPTLKRIIFVSDLFEFDRQRLETGIYFQPQMMQYFEPWLEAAHPTWVQRIDDYFSILVVDRSFRTLKDYLAYKNGKYMSAYAADGSTTQSMIGARVGDKIENRARNSALALQTIYGEMKELDSFSIQVYQHLAALMSQHPEAELHIILAPFHEVFYHYFKDHFEKTKIYEKWKIFLKSLNRSNVKVHDFSYPAYLQYGIRQDEHFWQDGTHFTSQIMLQMAQEIYGW